MSASPSSSLYIDSADALFLRLEQGSDPLLPLSERYDTLRYVFRRAVEARLLSLPIVFGSLFAKVDHLLKQCSLPPHVVHAIHATRTVLFPRAAQVAATAVPDEYSYPSHLTSVCQLLPPCCAPVFRSTTILYPGQLPPNAACVCQSPAGMPPLFVLPQSVMVVS